MHKLTILLIGNFLLLSWPALAFEKSRAQDLPKYYKVSEGILRGGHPSKAGVEKLYQDSIKTVINLENKPKDIKTEKTWVESYGMKYISVPMGWTKAPADSDIDYLLEVLADPTNHPVYIHCKHGRDRTGLVIGLHRVFGENWDPAKAYKEMLDIGFRPKLKALDNYFKDQTGYED